MLAGNQFVDLIICIICNFFPVFLVRINMHNQNVAEYTHCRAFFEVLELEIFFSYNGTLIYHLLVTFTAIDSPDIVLSRTHPRYVNSECCFTFMSLYSIFKLTDILCLLFTCKKNWFCFFPHQNGYSICYQQTSHKGFLSLHWVVLRFSQRHIMFNIHESSA